jgi:hypothetical protein
MPDPGSAVTLYFDTRRRVSKGEGQGHGHKRGAMGGISCEKPSGSAPVTYDTKRINGTHSSSIQNTVG